jgi:hypothetical protein
LFIDRPDEKGNPDYTAIQPKHHEDIVRMRHRPFWIRGIILDKGDNIVDILDIYLDNFQDLSLKTSYLQLHEYLIAIPHNDYLSRYHVQNYGRSIHFLL